MVSNQSAPSGTPLLTFRRQIANELVSKLAKFAGTGMKFLPVPGAGVIGDVVGGAGAALGGASEAAANNRGAQLDAATQRELLNQARQRQFFEQAAAREQDRRAGGDDAWRAAQQAE